MPASAARPELPPGAPDHVHSLLDFLGRHPVDAEISDLDEESCLVYSNVFSFGFDFEQYTGEGFIHGTEKSRVQMVMHRNTSHLLYIFYVANI